MSDGQERDSERQRQRADFDLLHDLRRRLGQTRLSERARLSRELDRLYSRRQRGNDFDSAVASLNAAVESSLARVEALRALPIKVQYDPDLPITAHRDAILSALANHQVIVLCGATGSGKTTQLPKFCLEAGRGALGLIGHTQPRRIAARAIAARLASELGTTVGGAVGYQVRFNDRSGPDCRVKLMTDGILLKELESDRWLNRYDTLIVDEAHERSLNIDLLLGVLKRILEKRADLKLIVTSATIDPQKFSAFFGAAPIIEVSGRSYPVEVRYRPLIGEDEDAAELSLPEGVVESVRELDKGGRGDVLVFLPGEKQIRDCNEALSRAKFGNTEILPLFSRLSTRDQERIFEGHAQRRVVLATNVAETSLTVPGIRNVIDSGLARISRYSVRGKVQRLPIEKISKASADQRKGRCGREAEGICIRLFSEDDFVAREEFTPPEVLRTNLASVILRLAVLGLGEPADFPFVDPPDTRLINDGYRLLWELKAVDEERNVTALGKRIAALPVDPRLARMLIAASQHACLAEMLIVTSFLEIQDPRERPVDAQTQADQAHALFADPRSDFISVLNLWNAHRTQAESLSGSQLRKWCREHFLSFVRMREWQELHRQLRESVEEIELRESEAPADYANFHQAILTGFLGNIGALDEKREYVGARGSRFVIAPGTPLASKPPKWLVAGSIVETTRVFARMVASIEPPWIERAGEHLLKRSHSEPEWVEERGFVSALESVSLYGLTLAGQRRVNYGSVAPKEAREILIREALVERRTAWRADFLESNWKLRERVESMEARIRRRDILVDDRDHVEFYLARIPDNVHSIAALDKWLKPLRSVPHSDEKARSLFMSLADLMRRSAPEASDELFPDALLLGDNRLTVTYTFDPGQSDDGATLLVPEPLLASLHPEQLAWVIPGWRLEKMMAVLRALPKEQRKHFVPVPEAAARCLRDLEEGVSTDAVAGWISREANFSISSEQVMQLSLPNHLRLNIRVVKLDGKFLTEGRDLLALRRTVRSSNASIPPSESTVYRTWDFDDLPLNRTVERSGIKFTVYPALYVKEGGAAMIECSSPQEADALSRRGMVRLAVLALPQQAKLARQAFTARRELVLLTQAFGPQHALIEQFIERVFLECFFSDDVSLPRTRAEFQSRLDAHRSRIGETIERLILQAIEVLTLARDVRQLLASVKAPLFKDSLLDMEAQLTALMPADFLIVIPNPWFSHLPRYLRALKRRLERLPGNAKRDIELMKSIAPFAQAIKQFTKKSPTHPELDKLRWMIEEYRVSSFAQDLKTSIPVSDKRLTEQVLRAREEYAR